MTIDTSQAQSLAKIIGDTLAKEYEGHLDVGNIPPHTMEDIQTALEELSDERDCLKITNSHMRLAAEVNRIAPLWLDMDCFGTDTEELIERRDFMMREGYKICDNRACNCNSWHKAPRDNPPHTNTKDNTA